MTYVTRTGCATIGRAKNDAGFKRIFGSCPVATTGGTAPYGITCAGVTVELSEHVT
jgi:hypothetical protein